MEHQIYTVLVCAALMHFATGHSIEGPCEPRLYPNRSSVCVCNETYCDTIYRFTPISAQAFVYTTSKTGKRFIRSRFPIERNKTLEPSVYTLDLDPLTTYQTVRGFGGAITDAVALNWQNLEDDDLKQSLIDSYFSAAGLEYNLLRVPIGGSDYSTHPYAYNETPEDDMRLGNFSLAPEDYDYKIPMIKACTKAATSGLKIVGTVWSPPGWMKDSGSLTGASRLKDDYYQTFADYHCKFIQEYRKQGVSVWGITTSNQPMRGVTDSTKPNAALQWTISDMGHWIEKHLGPTMRLRCPRVKIIGVDDQKLLLPLWFNILSSENPKALRYLNGMAIHYFFDKDTPASQLRRSLEGYPGLFVIATEDNDDGTSQNVKVDLGSWVKAANYAKNIIQDLNNDVVGWIDLNLCVDTEGGPNWTGARTDSAIIVDAAKKEFYKQPMFYAIGHFSKFIPRGSVRIKVTERFRCGETILNVAFLTPRNTVVVVMYNNEDTERAVTLKLRNRTTTIKAEPKAILTVEIPRVNKRARYY